MDQQRGIPTIKTFLQGDLLIEGWVNEFNPEKNLLNTKFGF